MVGGSETNPGQRTWVLVMNHQSGTTARNGHEEILQKLLAVAKQQGVTINLLDLKKDLRGHLEGAEMVIAAGGDGTIASVAGDLVKVGESAPPMAVLPLGTFNNFAKSIGLPATWEECVDTLPQWVARPIDVGMVHGSEDAGRVFLNVVTLGVHPAMVKDRDARLKERPQGKWLGKWPAMLRASWEVLKRFPRHRLTLTIPGREITLRSPGLYVCRECGRLEAFGLTGGEERKLALLVGKTQSRLGALWLAALAAVGRLPGAEGFEVMSVDCLKISTRIAHRLDLAVDGEHVKIETPIEFELRKNALRVCMPK